MYFIDSKRDKPDTSYLVNRVKQMMNRGIAVGNLQAIYNKYASTQSSIGTELQVNYGIINPNSSKQIVSYMQSLDNAEVYEVCYVNDKWTTNKEALGALASKGYQFAIDLLDYRKAKKYAESIKSLAEAMQSDGRVHPEVSLSKTNRINYSSPALMNIPKPLLWHTVMPIGKNNVLISADIKNQEPNILINMLNAEELKGALVAEEGLYENLFTQPFRAKATLNLLVLNEYKPGLISNSELSEIKVVPPSFYTPKLPSVISSYYNGVQIRYIDVTNVVVPVGGTPELPDKVLIETIDGKQYKVPVLWDAYNEKKLKAPGTVEVQGQLMGIEIRCEGVARKEFKVAWNAMTYGASIYGVKAMCKNIDGEAIYKYFSKIEPFNKYRNNCKKLADAGKQTISTYFGTPLSANEFDRFKLRRILMDLPVQGTAADILSLLIKHCDEEISVRGIEDKLSIYYTRHDEIIFEADGDWVNEIGLNEVNNIIRDMVEHQVDNWIPFKVEIDKVDAGAPIVSDVDDPFE